MDILIFLGFCYLLAIATWVFYLAMMNLYGQRHRMRRIARLHFYALLPVAFLLDLLLNWIVGTLVFASLPRELMFTTRLIRHQLEGGWRGVLAEWICTRMLNQFDPTGGHC